MSTPATVAARSAGTTVTGNASAMDKLKNMGMILKEKAQVYIEANPDKVEEMKKHALDNLQKQIDDEAEKEHKAKLALETDGKKPSKIEKLKETTIGFIKPQVDKLAEKQTAAVEANKVAAAAAATTTGGEATEESVEFSASESGVNKSGVKTTKEEKEETAAAVMDSDDDDVTSTPLSEKSDDAQDVIANLLNMLDESNLSDEQKKKVVNGFNAAFVLKQL